MFEIAGLIISGVSLIKDLYVLHADLSSWSEEDLEVDIKWLVLALQEGVLLGEESDYKWTLLKHVPTLELEKSHHVVIAHNDDKKVLYRLVRGSLDNRDVLMKKRVSD